MWRNKYNKKAHVSLTLSEDFDDYDAENYYIDSCEIHKDRKYKFEITASRSQ